MTSALDQDTALYSLVVETVSRLHVHGEKELELKWKAYLGSSSKMGAVAKRLTAIDRFEQCKQTLHPTVLAAITQVWENAYPAQVQVDMVCGNDDEAVHIMELIEGDPMYQSTKYGGTFITEDIYHSAGDRKQQEWGGLDYDKGSSYFKARAHGYYGTGTTPRQTDFCCLKTINGINFSFRARPQSTKIVSNTWAETVPSRTGRGRDTIVGYNHSVSDPDKIFNKRMQGYASDDKSPRDFTLYFGE